MILFFGIYLAALLLCVLSNLFKNKFFDKITVLSISLILSILPGFRAVHIGFDTLMYDTILYSDLSEGTIWGDALEPGYILLVKLFQFFSIEPYFFYFVSFVANFLIITTIFNLKRNRFLALLSYLTFSQVFLIGFNILRQYFALSIFVFSLKYLFESRFFKFTFFVLLATTIHYTSIFYLFFIPLYILLRNNYTLSAFSFAFIFPFLYNFAQKNLVYILINFTGKEGAVTYIGRTQESGAGIWYAFYLLILLYFVLLRNNKNFEYLFFLSTYILFLGFYANISFLGLAYEGAGRLIVCTYFSLIFIFSYLKYDRYVVLHYLVFIFIFMFLFVYLYLIRGIHRIFPYESIF